MATGTGNLPNIGMSFTPFDILTAEELNDLVENIEALATGTGLGDGSIPTAAYGAGSVTNVKLATTAGEIGGAWTTWAPTYGGNGSLTFTSVTTDYAKWTQVGKTVFFQLAATGTAGGTTNTRITFTLPVAALASTNIYAGFVVDSIVEAGGAFQSASTTVVNVVRAAGNNWTLGAGRQIRASGSYEVA